MLFWVAGSADAKTIINQVDLADGGKAVYYDDGSYEIKLNQEGNEVDYKVDTTSTGYQIDSTVKNDGQTTTYSATTNETFTDVDSTVKVETDTQTTQTTNSVRAGVPQTTSTVMEQKTEIDTPTSGSVRATINGNTIEYNIQDIGSGRVKVGGDVSGLIDISGDGKITIDSANGVTLQAQYSNGGLSGATRSYVVNLGGDSEYLIAGYGDLAAYNQLVIAERPQVKKIDVGDDSVEITYKQPARLFGFIPTNVSGKIEVDSDGQVDVRLPWYSFLYAKDTEPLRKSVVGTLASANTVVNPKDLVSGDETKAARVAAQLVNFTSFVTDRVSSTGNKVIDTVVTKTGDIKVVTEKGATAEMIKELPGGTTVDVNAVINDNSFDVAGKKNADGSIDLIQNINGNDINFKAVPNADGTYNVQADYNGYLEEYQGLRIGR